MKRVDAVAPNAVNEQYFPPIKHAVELSHESANYTVEDVGHFKTQGEARSYNTQYLSLIHI